MRSQPASYAEAAELIEANWVSYAIGAGTTTVLAWLRQFPEEMQSNDAALLLVKAWMLTLPAKRTEAGRALAAVERLTEPGRGRFRTASAHRGGPEVIASLLPVG